MSNQRLQDSLAPPSKRVECSDHCQTANVRQIGEAPTATTNQRSAGQLGTAGSSGRCTCLQVRSTSGCSHPCASSETTERHGVSFRAPGANWEMFETMFVKRTNTIEFENWGVETRENVEREARQYLPEHIRAGFEDEEPGAPYPQDDGDIPS